MACAQAAERGADIAMLPELWQIGYAPCPDDPVGKAEWQELAIELNDPWLTAFRKAAADLNIAILATFLERWPDAPRNTAVLINRHGQDVLRYAKVHTCDFGMEKNLTPGHSFEVAPLDTAHGSVDVGVMICYDREFPESARELMLGGAEIILVPNACPMGGERTSQLRSRAFENMTAVALCNYAAPDSMFIPRVNKSIPYDGHSSVFDGMAFQSDGQPRDHQLLQVGDEEGVFVARVDLDSIRAYRARETQADTYRKPAAYRRLTGSRQDVEVFSRSDSRRG